MLWGIKTKNSQFVNFKDEHLSQMVVQKQSTKESSQSIKLNKKVVIRKSLQQLIRELSFYKPVSKYIDMNELKRKPNIQTKRYRQCIYFGQVRQNKKQGQGIMLYTNGRIYEGEWRNNMKQGKGYENFPNQSIYNGAYQKGKPHGYGKYEWENGQIYQGQWIDGLKNGSGIWRGSQGDSYIGEWKNGKAEGYGVHTWINGNRYEGQFKQCLKHGEGIQKFANGDIYKGYYQDGKPHGQGQYFWSDESSYKGEFKQGLRNGKGIWRKSIQPNADTYQGEFINQKKQGYGVFIWTNGSKYIGNFTDDLRQGYGQMYWSDGTVYKGQWKNGCQVQQIKQQNNLNFNSQGLSHELMSVSVPVKKQGSRIDQQQFFNPEDSFDFQMIAQPNQPQILQLKKFRAREMASRNKSRVNQKSMTRFNESFMICNNYVSEAFPLTTSKNPRKMMKRSSRLSFNGASNHSTYLTSQKSRIKHSQSTSEKKAMSVCLFNNSKMDNRSMRQIPIKNFQGVELRQDTSQQYSCRDSRCNTKTKPRVIKSSNGVRNLQGRNQNVESFWEQIELKKNFALERMNSSDQETKWFTRSKNELKYF